MSRPHSPNCGTCCTCPAPEIATVQRAASKTKCGVNSITIASDAGGLFTYSGPAGHSYLNASINIASSYSAGGGTCTRSFNRSVVYTVDGSGNCTGPTYTCSGSETTTTTGCSATTTLNADCTYSGGACPATCNPTYTVSGSFTNEYATAELQSNTVTSLPDWGDLSTFSPGSGGELASAELNSDGSSYSIMESKYQWAHPVPPLGYYKLTWDEVFTPDSGGPVSTPKSYVWDGTTPGGYNPSDNTTWPTSSIFEVDYPSSNGSISMANLGVSCIPSS
jgi:hypothetical protein